MKNIRKINLAEVSDKQTLSIDQLSKIIGGAVQDACHSGVCSQNADANTKYCEGSSVCTQAVSTCTTNADTDDKDDKPTCVSSMIGCTSRQY